MDISAEKLQHDVSFVDVISEVFQILLIQHKQQQALQNSLKISIQLKGKGQVTCEGLSIYRVKISCSAPVPLISCLEENCMPSFSKLICSMQAQEHASHLAIQAVDGNNCQQKKTTVLWLDTIKETGSTVVNVESESVLESEDVDDIDTVIQIRAFKDMRDIFQAGKWICDMMERIKFINPKIQMSFFMNIGATAEAVLCDTDSVVCDSNEISPECDALIRNCVSMFTCGSSHVKQSREFDVNIQLGNSEGGLVTLVCILCYVPMISPGNENQIQNLPFIPGQIRIQMYGPAGLPFNMNAVTKNLSLSPSSLLPWHKFGFQAKTSFTCSAYDFHCSVRIMNKSVLHPWVTECHRFCLVFAFVVNDSSTECSTVKAQQELFRQLEQQVFTDKFLSVFQDAAHACMSDLLRTKVNDNKEETLPLQVPATMECKTPGTDLFKKMIPEVVNSLTDIFTRSTNMTFRSQVAATIPTSSRMNMSSHLEKLLWKMVHNPVYHSENVHVSPQLHLAAAEESQVDEWEISQESLRSQKDKRKDSMSPDSLDFVEDWEDADTDDLNIRECVFGPCESSETSHNKDVMTEDPFFDDFLADEEETVLWRQLGQLSCSDDDCLKHDDCLRHDDCLKHNDCLQHDECLQHNECLTHDDHGLKHDDHHLNNNDCLKPSSSIALTPHTSSALSYGHSNTPITHFAPQLPLTCERYSNSVTSEDFTTSNKKASKSQYTSTSDFLQSDRYTGSLDYTLNNQETRLYDRELPDLSLKNKNSSQPPCSDLSQGQSSVKVFPRKRSSEYIDDEYHNDCNTTEPLPNDIPDSHSEWKKHKSFESKDGETDDTLQSYFTPQAARTGEGVVKNPDMAGVCAEALSSVETTVHGQDVDSDWFDEEEVANWWAEMA